MKRVMLLSAACLTLASSAGAQERVDPMAATVAQWFTMIEKSFVSLANAMPADRWNFAPSSLIYSIERSSGGLTRTSRAPRSDTFSRRTTCPDRYSSS